MNIETLWYCLVGAYFFWLTACAAAVTALLIGAARSLRNIIRSVK